MAIRNTSDFGLDKKTTGESGWIRPSDWLTMPSFTPGEQKAAMLYGVYPNNELNYVKFQVGGTGNFDIDWGDGTVETHTGGSQITHQFDFNNVALNGTEMANGNKQSMIVVTPAAGVNLTYFNFHIQYDTSWGRGYSYSFLDMIFSLPFATSLTFGSNAVYITMDDLESVTFLDLGSITSMSQWFKPFNKLKQVIFDCDTSGITNMGYAFEGCGNLISAPQMDTSNVAIWTNTFRECISMKYVPTYDYSAATDMGATFYGCAQLEEFSDINAPLNTSYASIFSYCKRLRRVGSINATSCTNMSSMFSFSSIEKLPDMDTSNVQSFGSMCDNAGALEEIELDMTSAVGSLAYFARGATALKRFKLTGTPAVGAITSCTQMFYTTKKVEQIDLFDTSANTNFTYVFADFYGDTYPPFDQSSSASTIITANHVGEIPNFNPPPSTGSLTIQAKRAIKLLVTGIQCTTNISNMNLDSTELNNVYTNLATVSGKTITVTSNRGVGGDDPSIATAKGWTVVG